MAEDDDSASDWDSMSEAVGNRAVAAPQLPPFDFSGEHVRTSAALASSPSLPGKSQPRRPHVYSVASDDPDAAMDYRRRFDSPARHSPASSSADTVVKADSAVTVANASTKKTTIDGREKEKTIKKRPPLTRHAPEDELAEARSSEGVTNPAFDGLDFVLEEKPDVGTRAASPEPSRRPKAEESICIYKFEQPINSYFQVGGNSSDRWPDKFSSRLLSACSVATDNVVAVVKIPFVVVFLILGQVISLVVECLLRPFSDFLLKPVLVALHNFLLVPLCGLAHNFCVLTAHAFAPVCSVCTRNNQQSNTTIKSV